MLIKELCHDKKTIKDLTNTITNKSTEHEKVHRWSTTGLTSTSATRTVNNLLNSHQHHNHQNRYHLQQTKSMSASMPVSANQEKNSRDETDFHHCGYSNTPTTLLQNNINQQTNQISTSKQQQQQNINQTRPKSLPLAANTAPAIVSAIVKKIPPVLVTTSSNLHTDTNNNDNNKSNNNNINNNNSNKSKSSPRLQLQLKCLQQKHQNNNKNNSQQQRGDPDGGCNLDDLSNNYLSKTSELRVNLQLTTTTTTTTSVTPTSASSTNTNFSKDTTLNVKKGWLLKQDNRSGDWSKHWFSLNGAALFYYRDAVCEERGVLDGVLDVNSLTQVSVDESATKGYGFTLTTWDKRRLTLASLSPNSRTSWMAALRNAAGLQISNNNVINCNTKSNIKPPLPQDAQNKIGKVNSDAIEKDILKAQPRTTTKTQINPMNEIVTSPLTPPTPKSINSHMSSDEEYRTASEGGRRDSIDWGSPLSPSPPTLNLLRIKERVRARSTQCPRLHKRSRSSPPSSRRSTLDSVGSDELPTPPYISTVQEELNIDKELQFRLRAAETECDLLRTEAKQQDQRIAELLESLERTEQQLNTRLQDMEQIRDNLQSELESSQLQAECVVNRLTDELNRSQIKIKDLEDRLMRGIDENEALYKRLRELESCSPSTFSNLKNSKLKRMDSLSDLTTISDIDPFSIERDSLAEEYNEVRSRFEKAINEIRAMKRELKQSQNQYDSLEISYASLKQDLERKVIEDRGQLQMMAARIQDLTLKYSSSERQVRALKQKLAKSERRRSLSLKGTPKDQIHIAKEFEGKVCDLERKIDQLEYQSKSVINTRVKKSSSSRRCSLETSGSSDSLQLLLRVNDLEQRVDGVTQVSSNHSITISPHLIARLRSLETVLMASKDRLETSLQHLQNYRAARTRRSLSPSSNERKDCYRQLERGLNEVLKLLQESSETCVIGGTNENGKVKQLIVLSEKDPVKLALTHLENQLRNKLCDLLKQRRLLRDRNALSTEKQFELLAQRIAFESIVFGQLREALNRAENREDVGKIHLSAEIAETTHLMRLLKAKLSGKCVLKPNASTDILAGVLARRLLLSGYQKKSDCQVNKSTTSPTLNSQTLDILLQQQNELNLIMKRYKVNALDHLATGLAAETLSYIPGNDMVQGAVQEAWRHAQEAVNAELVQTEIAQVMLRQAERLENTNKLTLGFTLSTEEYMCFEQFSDAAHTNLRREMELATNQLSHAYESALTHLKRGQWNLMHLEQEPKASEARLLLSEFADIIAHKALVDARISILRGEHCTTLTAITNDHTLQVTALMKYENLFEDLSNDMQISDSASILAEADFDFIFKQQTIEFLNTSDNSHIYREISTYLAQLEDALLALRCETTTIDSVLRSGIVVENWQDICQKCCLLRQRADELLQDMHRRLQKPCKQCQQLRAQLESRQQQYESEFLESKQHNAQELNTLLQQVDQQRQALKVLEMEKQSLSVDLNRSQERIKQQESDLRYLQAKDADQNALLQRLKCQEQNFRQQDDLNKDLELDRDNLKIDLLKERERRQLFEKRLEMLEVEHTKQLECLQEAYRDQLLAHCSDFSSSVDDEESFRQRYQMEIEHLRTLCEKGLSAMESSHRRIISDLKEIHRQEIERLLLEKETALAEETQATLAALDAMRKAHQSEVQREVARFKQEFFKQIQRGEQFSLDSAQAKEEELEELRKEILSFSEKYSIKCVENAALEEKLHMVSQKLKHLQQMQQLELRNKQFRAHLASEDPAADANFVQGLTTSHMEDSPGQDSEHRNSAEELTIVETKHCKQLQKIKHKQGVEYRNLLTESAHEPTKLELPFNWSYEPCYNLRTYRSPLRLEGLKCSTFGKDLRKA